MIKILVLAQLSLATLASGCSGYNPVCGSNGMTYSNSCLCLQAKVSVKHAGACGSSSSWKNETHGHSHSWEKYAQPNQNYISSGSHMWTQQYGKDITAERLHGNKWETIGNDLGTGLMWNYPVISRNDGLHNYHGKRWATTPLVNKRNWTYDVVPQQGKNYYWQPNQRVNVIDVDAQPIYHHKVGVKKVDHFHFPAWEQTQKASLPEADWTIDKSLYPSVNPKRVFVSGDGTWASGTQGAELPQLYTSQIGGWSGAMRGGLDQIEIQKQPLKYLGQKEVSNNWGKVEDLKVQDYIKKKASNANQNKAAEAAMEAFDNIDLRQHGYRYESESAPAVQVSVTTQQTQNQAGNQTEVQNWLDSLKTRALSKNKQSSQAKQQWSASNTGASQSSLQNQWGAKSNSWTRDLNAINLLTGNLKTQGQGTSSSGMGSVNTLNTGSVQNLNGTASFGNMSNMGGNAQILTNQLSQNSNAINGFVGDSLLEGGIKMQGGANNNLFSNGWYDMWTYENPGSGYFINNSQFINAQDDFGTLGETTTYKLVNGKWVVTHEGDTWVNTLPSAGGKQMVGLAL